MERDAIPVTVEAGLLPTTPSAYDGSQSPSESLLPRTSRRERARRRLGAAREALAHCRLCAHDCGVNRLAGEYGTCRAGAVPTVFSAQVEVSDELELIPTFAIAFGGCDLRCAFCITGRESWNPRSGFAFDAARLAEEAEAALTNGARTIMILGGEPTIHLPAALELVAHLPEEATLLWKTNAHGSAEARELLRGCFDGWVADYKFGNDDCAQRLARVKNYREVVHENLLWAHTECDLIVRHLLMPGHVECWWAPVAEWLAQNLPGVRVSLRSGFWPAWRAARHAELRETVTAREHAAAWAVARDYGLQLIE